MKLEELARQSSTAARVSVAHLDVPSMRPGSPKRSWAPVVVGVAVSALVIGGLAVLSRDRDDGTTPADTVLPTVIEIPRLGLALDGWSVSFAGSVSDISDGLDDLDSPEFVYFGTADSDDPFSDGDLLIASFTDADTTSRPDNTQGGETIELRGTTATVSTLSDQGLPSNATSLTWNEVADDGTATEVVVVSRSFDVSELTEIAEAFAIDAGVVTPGSDLALERVATSAGSPFDALRRSDDGYIVVYENDANVDTAVISSARGGVATEATVMRWWTDEVADVEIDGRPGFVATFPDSDELGPMLTWSPADGMIASISHFGSDDTIDVVALAALAFEIDDATWANYLDAATGIRSGVDEFDEVFGQGDGAVAGTDYSWVLGLQGDSLCLNLQTGNEGSGSCQQRDGIEVPDGTAVTIDNGFGSLVAEVVIVADPAVEEIIETSGTYVVERVEADGASWFVAIGDTNTQPTFEVIVDGAVVAELGAAVEASADEVSVLTENSAAVELGIDGMEIAVFGGQDSDFSFWIGRNESDLCLVTGGVAESAACVLAEDVVVFPPTASPSGDVTLVVARDVPDCVESSALEVGESAPENPGVGFAGGGGDEQHGYDYWGAFGEATDWTLRLDAGLPTEIVVDLPAGGSGVPYPAGICDS